MSSAEFSDKRIVLTSNLGAGSQEKVETQDRSLKSEHGCCCVTLVNCRSSRIRGDESDRGMEMYGWAINVWAESMAGMSRPACQKVMVVRDDITCCMNNAVSITEIRLR